MPDTPPTLTHFRNPARPLDAAVCGEKYGCRSSEPGDVTCFACRRTPDFTHWQGVGAPTPGEPGLRKLDQILAEHPVLGESAPEWNLAAHKNERGMYTIEEFIHHGDYRSRRNVEVYAINETTVDAVLQSSAYCYGSWAHAAPQHFTHRKTALAQLVDDLKHGRVNRSIGWSTFRLVT